MSIFFSPIPPKTPNPSVTVADAFAGSQDIYIGGIPTGVASVGLLGSGLNAGKIAYASFNPANTYLGLIAISPMGKGTGIVPGLITTVLSLDNTAAVGQPTSFIPVSIYGGAANPSTTPCPYTVTVDTLPAGLSLYTSVTTIDVTGPAPTQDATFQVTFTFTASKLTGLSPVVGKFYAVRGQSKLSYNGIWECKAVTSTSITLKYNASPAASGGTAIANQVAWSTTSPTTISDISQKTISDAGGVLSWYNYTEILIAGTPTAPATKKGYTIRFTDATGQSKTETFNLEVTGGAQPLDTVLDPYTSLLSQNVTVSFTPVRATGGTGTIKFTAPGGLPAGLSISSSGLISGIPSIASASQTYTILATDAGGATSSKSITLEVKAPAVNVTLAQSQGYSYTATVPFADFKPVLGTGGIAPLTYTVSPAVSDYGLTFTSTGTIKGPGTTVTGGPKSFEVTVTDSNKPTSSTNKLSFSLEITALPALTVSVNSSTIVLTKNSAVGLPTTPISASGGYLNKSFSINNNATLTSVGLTFNTSTGVLSGSPTALLSPTPFIVTVTDQAPTPQTKTATFTLSVLSVPLKTTLAVTGKIAGITNVAITTVTPVTATGGDGAYKYSIVPDITAQLGLAFTTVTNGAILGGTISGTPTAATSGIASYAITVTDAALQTSSTSFTIQIDNPPPLTVASIGTKTLLHKDPVTAFTPIYVISPGYSTLKYAITGTNNTSLPSGLNFNTSNGEITGTPSTYLITATTFSVTVSDQAKQITTGTFTLTVNTQAIIPTVITPKVFTKLVANSYQPVSVTGGSEVYRYAINPSPSLPPNLSFSTSTGVISGTAASTSTSGSNTYTVTVTDSLNTQSISTFVLTVQDAPALATTSSISSSTFYKNESIGSAIIPVTLISPGSGALKFETLPTDLAAETGLTFNTSNGQISGSPSTYINKTYTIKVTDGLGQTSSQPYALIVTYRPLATTTATMYMQLTRNKQITAFTPITASYGAGGNSFTISPFLTLPTGLNFNNSTGEISGKPTTTLVTTTFTVTVVDSANNSSSKNFNLYVKDPPSLTVSKSTAGVITLVLDSSFTSFIPVVGSGGDGTITYTKPPNLPNGLIYDISSGAISGRASIVSNTTSYIVTATDSLSQTSSTNFLLNVIPKPIIVSIDHPTVNGTALQYINPIVPITAQGSGNLSYALDRPLPSPLQFSNGSIDGTPLAATDTNYTVIVTDTYGQTNSGTFHLLINEIIPDPLVATAGQSLYSLEIYSAQNFQPVTATGGVGTYTYSILPTTLPSGLEFDPTSGNILGQPDTKFTSTNYVVTVFDKKPQSTTATFNLEVIIPVITAGKGYSGSRGFTGSRGYTGSTGTQGVVGFTGSASTASGYIGSTGYTGSQGDQGYWGSVGYAGSASTASGYIGSTGYVGSQGYTGSQGETGYWGSVGFTGSIGYIGSTGFIGSRGEIGYWGSVGYWGSRGFTGSRGSQGIQGPRGADGAQGDQGNDGAQGDKGDTGYVGSQGNRGDLGFTGSIAYTGSSGYAGSQGVTGFVGSQGIPGAYAALGYFGSTGYTGSVGFVGSQGESSFVYSDTAPLDPAVGARWLDSITGAEVVWTDDGVSSQWIEVAASGFLGKTGDVGYWGSTGYWGSVGYTGSFGYTGSQGLIGFSGSIGINVRSTIAGTSAAISNLNTGSINITAFKGYNLYKIQTSAAAWVRIYATSAARTADLYRSASADPASDAGVITEIITTMSQTVTLTPAVLGFNDENPVTNIIPISVTNYSGASTSITITLTMVQTEV